MMWMLWSCFYEDGSREHGEACGRDEDCIDAADCETGDSCADRLVCQGWICVYPDGSREWEDSCVVDDECPNNYVCFEKQCRNEEEAAYLGGEGGGITCNDGTRSPTCTTCSSGCCSGHGGCL